MPTPQDPLLLLIASEIEAAGDATTTATTDKLLEGVLFTIWEMYADKALLHPRLRYLYAKRQVIDFWLSSVWRDVSYTEDVQEALNQQSDHLTDMRKLVHADITQIEADVASSVGAVTGELSTKTPLAGLCGRPDPNNTIYRGDARYRGRTWPF